MSYSDRRREYRMDSRSGRSSGDHREARDRPRGDYRSSRDHGSSRDHRSGGDSREQRGNHSYSRQRDRSRSRGGRDRDRSRSPIRPKGRRMSVHDRPTITPADLEGKTEDEKEMIMTMGFASFDSTKGRYLLLNPDEKIDMRDYYDDY